MAQDPDATQGSPSLVQNRYAIEKMIGEGGLGMVYRAFDTRLKRPVAIKTLKRSVERADPGHFQILEERFVREAEAGSRMGSHPNLVTVHDLLTDTDGTLYLILEYVGGGTLTERIAEGPLPMADALRLTADAARGLQAAHEKGLVHRDIKPSNIFIAEDGRAQVGDFGIAQIEHASARTRMTTGHPGTPLYMSPEQSVTTGYVRPLSDQYSLGLVLFEMLVGTAYKRVGKREADRLLGTQPRAVQWLVSRMLADDPDDRYPSMSAVLSAIQAIERTADPDPALWARSAPAFAPTIPSPDAKPTTPFLNLQPASPVLYPAPVVTAPFTPATYPVPPAGKPRSLWLTPLFAIIVLIVIGGTAVGAFAIKRNHDATASANRTLAIQQDHYAAGDAAITRQAYDIAMKEFAAAGQYKDAPQRQIDAQRKMEQKQAYADGQTALTKADYATAAAAFLRAGNYQDGPQQAAQAQALDEQQRQYQAGVDAVNREDFATAAVAFRAAGTYKDAPQKAVQAQMLDGQQRQYQAGIGGVSREDFGAAAIAFRAAGTFKDAPQQATAAEKLRDQKASYDAGAAAAARGDFKVAKQQFLTAGSYKDAPARAANAEQEDMLLTLYDSGQGHLKASQWREAYADFQQIQRTRTNYKDVNDIVRHLENDVANPTTIDLYAVLNSGNGYKKGAIPINNLIGKPLAYIVIVRDWSYENQGRGDLISNVRVYIEKAPDSQVRDNTDVPILSASDIKKYRDSLEKDERLVVITGNGQVIDVQEFGNYHAKLTVTNVGVQDRPMLIGNNFGTDPIFSRLFVDVALTAR